MNTWINEESFEYKEYSVKVSCWWELKSSSNSITLLKKNGKSHISILFISLAFVERHYIFVTLILSNLKRDGDCWSSQFQLEFTCHSVPSQDTGRGKLFLHSCPRSKVECLSLSCFWLFVTPWRPPGSSVYGILQVRILEWVIISFSREFSQPRDQTGVSFIANRFLTVWVIREACPKIKRFPKLN